MKNNKTADPSSILNSSNESDNYKFIEHKKLTQFNKEEIKIEEKFKSHRKNKSEKEIISRFLEKTIHKNNEPQKNIKEIREAENSKSAMKSTKIIKVSLNQFSDLNSKSSSNFYLIKQNSSSKLNIIKMNSEQGKKIKF